MCVHYLFGYDVTIQYISYCTVCVFNLKNLCYLKSIAYFLGIINCKFINNEIKVFSLVDSFKTTLVINNLLSGNPVDTAAKAVSCGSEISGDRGIRIKNLYFGRPVITASNDAAKLIGFEINTSQRY